MKIDQFWRAVAETGADKKQSRTKNIDTDWLHFRLKRIWSAYARKKAQEQSEYVYFVANDWYTIYCAPWFWQAGKVQHYASFTTDIQPRDYQLQAIFDIEQLRKAKKRSCLLHAPTGAGKSFMMLLIIQQLQARAIIIAPNATIAQQLHDNYKGHSTASINFIRWGWPHDLNHDILICTTSTFNMIYKEINWKIDVLIVDECHNLPETRIKQLCMWKWAHVIGASATLIRKEFRREGFEIMFGNVVDVEKTTQLNNQVLPVVVYTYRRKSDYSKQDREEAKKWYREESHEPLRQLIINDEERYTDLCTIVLYCRKKKLSNIIIFTDRTRHVERIIEKLCFFIDEKGVYSFTWSDDKQEFYDSYTWWVIVANTACAWEWFDVPMLQVGILFVSSRFDKSIIQYVWRVRRKYCDKKYWVFIDVQDNIKIEWEPRRKSLWQGARNKIYKSEWWIVRPMSLQ